MPSLLLLFILPILIRGTPHPLNIYPLPPQEFPITVSPVFQLSPRQDISGVSICGYKDGDLAHARLAPKEDVRRDCGGEEEEVKEGHWETGKCDKRVLDRQCLRDSRVENNVGSEATYMSSSFRLRNSVKHQGTSKVCQTTFSGPKSPRGHL